MKQTQKYLSEIPFSNEELCDDDVYYLGINYEEKDWEILGIFTSLEKAFSASSDGEFIVRNPINILLEKFQIHPRQSWWNINGELLQSERFCETN